MRYPRFNPVTMFLYAAALAAALAAPTVVAQGLPKGGPQLQGPGRLAFLPQQATLAAMRDAGFFPTGIEPVYPAAALCPAAESLFAAQTRSDRSQRQAVFFQGFHGGMDIPVPEGTPVLAVAAGTVIYKGEGGSIGGIGLILQHAPADTGLAGWTYTEYKHLREVPALALGTRVAMGQPIAASGKTGTEGGYYGAEGFAHLHLSAYFSAQPGYEADRAFVPAGGQWMDPLAFFRGMPVASAALLALPPAQKQVPIHFLIAGGASYPPGTKVIWPLACTPG